MTFEQAVAMAYCVAAVLGLRSTVRLVRLVRPVDPDHRAVLALLTWIAALITIAAGYFGLMSIRRLLGYEAFTWSPFVGTMVATVVLLIPVAIDLAVDRIQRTDR